VLFRSAVELVGWLELAWDDAPWAVVTGLVEGQVPAGGVADAWLPDRLRGALGLTDARRRWARDGYLMSLIVASKRGLSVVVPMRGDDGEPMTPSRLLFQGRTGAALAEGVLEVFDDRRPIEAVPRLGRTGERSGFVVPAPGAGWPRERSLSVSDFGLFLRDPYRFYVERVLGLGSVEAGGAEMGPLPFGRLVHEAVMVLGEGEWSGCTEAGALREAMAGRLREAVGRMYGGQPVTAVRAQEAIVLERLSALAERQAEWAAAGWWIAATEAGVSWPVEVVVDGEAVSVTIKGRIDRVDVNALDGRVRLIDYKTGDTGRSPAETHLTREGDWVDLQLPMYAEAAAGGAWVDEVDERLMGIGSMAEVELGYVLLPRDWSAVGFSVAKTKAGPWDAEVLASAIAARDAALVKILRGGDAFWPTQVAYDRGDAVSAMAGLTAADREALLRASGWEGGRSDG